MFMVKEFSGKIIKIICWLFPVKLEVLRANGEPNKTLKILFKRFWETVSVCFAEVDDVAYFEDIASILISGTKFAY